MTGRSAITNVRIFDGERLTAPTTVVMENGLLVAGSSLNDVDPVDIHEGDGGALLPGLIDSHVHVDEVTQLETAASWGVTTMLDMGNKDPAGLATLKTRTDLPTLLSAGYPASAPNSAFVRKMGYPDSSTVADPTAAARFVTARVGEGSDYIKILIEDPKIPGTKALDQARVSALVVAARSAGKMTVAHIVSGDTMLTALRAGVDVVTHTALTSELSSEVEQLLAERATTIIPTLVMMEGVLSTIGRKPLIRMIGFLKPSARMKYTHAEQTVQTFQRAGMPILVGTDANNDSTAPFQPPHGESLHEELLRLVLTGVPPVAVLRGATATAARVFGLSDRGAITPGLRADLVLVAGDPTQDISDTRRIRAVWIAGRKVRDTG